MSLILIILIFSQEQARMFNIMQFLFNWSQKNAKFGQFCSYPMYPVHVVDCQNQVFCRQNGSEGREKFPNDQNATIFGLKMPYGMQNLCQQSCKMWLSIKSSKCNCFWTISSQKWPKMHHLAIFSPFNWVIKKDCHHICPFVATLLVNIWNRTLQYP